VSAFDIFLSHNSADKLAVEEIGQKLKAAGLRPWLDKWELIAGTRWQGALADGLRACATCGVFIGPNGFGDWAREELDVAQNRAAKEPNFRLIPVLLPGLLEPFDFDSLPPFLTARTWVDVRQGFDDPGALDILIKAIKGLPPGSDRPASAASDVCPYRGLETFDEDHAEFFFGRERDIQRVTEKLKAARFLAVLGPSGSGKSSLVRAGVIPSLRRGALPGSKDWEIRVLRPSADPITALAAKIKTLNSEATMKSLCDDMLADPKTLHREAALALTLKPQIKQIVWVIDQFEEVFTLCAGEAERSQFLANILFASSIPDGPCVTLLTMRADFYGKCAAYPELSARIAAQQFLVSPMDLEMLREAIEEPARRVGLQFQPGLVDAILQDVENQPGSLPLLEHALLELWNRRSGTMLTLDGYQKSGGVEGAIAKTAEEIFKSFTPDEQSIVRRIMLRLTQLGEGTEDTRRRATMDEIVTTPSEADAVAHVVKAMADARLLTTT
jgi:energy-coupling factor transporter ATP-binding protein EcfA2